MNSDSNSDVKNGNGEAEQDAPFDWQACVDRFSESHAQKLAKWRGYSAEIVSFLHDKKLVGIYNGENIAFPAEGGAHYRVKADGSWRYSRGAKASPLIIGELETGSPVHCYESQFDAFAFMDASGERSGILITRGAANGARAASLIPKDATAYCWTQNDKAGEKWQADIIANTKATVKRAKIPAPHKDLNDWTIAGATDEDVFNAFLDSTEVSGAEKLACETEKPLIEFRSPLQLKNFTPPPGFILVGDCHIAKGSVFVIGGAQASGSLVPLSRWPKQAQSDMNGSD
jgi:hypothetical protein